MQVMYGAGRAKPALKNTVAAIGIFDGVHKGHQHLIRRMVASARRRKSKSIVVTFHPHPVEVLHHKKVAYLVSLPQRLELIKKLGVDIVMVIRFTEQFSRLRPEEFVEKYLVRRLGVQEVFVGDDFRFGQNRSGDVDSFEVIGKRFGFSVKHMRPVKKVSDKISSSSLRELIGSGSLQEAASMLGRKVSVSGKVVHGSARGKELGYPTANIKVDSGILPPQGVYVVRVGLNGRMLKGMVNLGSRPSFADKNPQMHFEAHILDFNKNIYGRNLNVEFIKKIRDEQKFSSVDELVSQIRSDEHFTRKYFRLRPALARLP